ncbi:carboxypeptidase regulatory-like domain-containing protein [Halomonas sp. M20]|uniref:carboxypeptidase regulatory-like domain-containing protein n=1 Tax=Halomonas sp. M20 TaxID=2763264 RepID=UPI001D0AEDA0|nr:carboxypeptidase regulatory-like domain-containing protein [Halomonas sp. M20]
MGKWIAIALAGLLLGGCEFVGRGPDTGPPVVEDRTEPPPEQVERKIAFPEQEYAKLDKNGTASISGRLFIRTASGVVYGAGETVSVAPATRYSAEAAEVALAGGYIEPADPRAQAYTHYAKADEQGYFKITGLPAGVFYVAGRVARPGGERVVIINQVSLGKGQGKKIELSR